MDLDSRTNASIATSSQDIWYAPPLTATNDSEYAVYMLPGNPCIMTYYQPFLSTLFSSLNDVLAPKHLSAHVGGYTPPGFRLSPGHIDGVPLPASLRAQVVYAEQLIGNAIKKHVDSRDVRENATRPKHILVSQSAGTYMSLEILRRYMNGDSALSHVDILGAVLICPTVTHIAKSRNGAVASSLFRIPAFPTILGTFAKCLTVLLPLSAISWIARVMGRVPSHVAQAFAEFLKGPYAVQQAMHLLRDMCHEVKEDTWSDSIWGSSEPSKIKAIPLKFHFAKDDGWVSNSARDALITSRGGTEETPWKPEMMIDDNGITHGFNESIHHSDMVAKKVAKMIEDIIKRDNLDGKP